MKYLLIFAILLALTSVFSDRINERVADAALAISYIIVGFVLWMVIP